jgi:cyclophilin family peptidyl-prolyl cis-trans isomerase
VLEGFMAQGGDPTGSGTGNRYEFVNENSDLTLIKLVMAMANAGPDTNGSVLYHIRSNRTVERRIYYLVRWLGMMWSMLSPAVTNKSRFKAMVETITITEK